jgi:hypothetical protein
MVLLVSPDGRIKLSNKMALNSLGYNEDEIKLLKLMIWFYPKRLTI